MSGADLNIIPGKLPQENDEKGALARFIRRHSRILIFIGAIVVFFTFVIREGFREYLKDLVDSIETARSMLTVERENQLMSQRLAEIYRANSEAFAYLRDPPPPNWPRYKPRITVSTIASLWQSTFDTLNRLKDETETSEHFFEVAPHEKKYDLELSELRCRYDDLSQSYKDFRPAGSTTPQSELMPNFWQISSLAHKGWDLEDEVQKLIAVVLDESIIKKKTDERYFKIATWFSYGLYAFGSGLGLIGKIYGVEGADDDED